MHLLFLSKKKKKEEEEEEEDRLQCSAVVVRSF
jgi:hypothetical protein